MHFVARVCKCRSCRKSRMFPVKDHQEYSPPRHLPCLQWLRSCHWSISADGKARMEDFDLNEQRRGLARYALTLWRQSRVGGVVQHGCFRVVGKRDDDDLHTFPFTTRCLHNLNEQAQIAVIYTTAVHSNLIQPQSW